MATSTNSKRVITLILLGNIGVGKTSLLSVYVDDTFLFKLSATVGCEIKYKDVVVDREQVKLTISDTHGEERFHALSPTYYRGTQGALVVYDVTDSKSFEDIKHWMDKLDKYCTKPGVVKVLIANKTDMKKKRQVTETEGRRRAQDYNIAYFECSAMEKQGVEAAFEHLVNEICGKDIAQVDKDDTDPARPIDLHKEIPQKKRGCQCK